MKNHASDDIAGWRAFQIQRTQILGLFNTGNTTLDSAYLFAWSRRVYPLFHTSVLHEGFEEFFYPTQEMIKALADSLDKAFMSGEAPPTVYDLEDKLHVRYSNDWDRSNLIDALRYMSLCPGRFSTDFWAAMTRDAGAPAEANSFYENFRPEWDADPN